MTSDLNKIHYFVEIKKLFDILFLFYSFLFTVLSLKCQQLAYFPHFLHIFPQFINIVIHILSTEIIVIYVAECITLTYEIYDNFSIIC